MAASQDLVDFQINLSGALSDLRTIRSDAESLGNALDAAADASRGYLVFRKILKVADAGLSASLTTLKLSENVAPLSAPSKALKEVLEVIQPRVVQIKDATDRAKKIEPLLNKIIKADNKYSREVLPRLETADEELTRIFDGTNEIVDAFDRVSTPNGNPFLNSNAGTERPGRTDFTGLFAEVDAFVAPVNELDGPADAAGAAYRATQLEFSNLLTDMGIAGFPNMNDIFGDLVEFEDLFEFLGEVLEIVQITLLPIEPLLNAVDAVASAIVDPAVDYLIDQVGADEVFDQMAAVLDPLFPSISPFEGFMGVVDAIETGLDDFDLDIFDVPEFIDRAFEAFDRFETTITEIELAALSILDGIPMRIGANDAETMYGTGGDEVFDPREGDDTILSNTGNDIILASEGDDVIRGGAGIDRVVFAGELVEYDFTRNDDTGELVFTHTNVGAHGFAEGTETITEVEYFDFGTETFTRDELLTATLGPSVLTGNDIVGERELIFLQPGGALISGMTLNGQTFNNMNVVYGRAGNDRIQGTLGNDFIFGGPGNDVLIPRTYNPLADEYGDALDGGEGIDTFQVFDLGLNPTHHIDLQVGFSTSVSAKVQLSDVENVIIQHNGPQDQFGDDDDNVLFSAGGMDLLSGRGGNDRLFGNRDVDILIGGLGIDRLRGGQDNDFLAAFDTSDNGPAELYDGGQGLDRLSYSTTDDELSDFIGGRSNLSDLLFKAMDDAGTTGPVIVRAMDGEVDRLDGQGNVIATDLAISIEGYIGSNGADILYGTDDGPFNTTIDGGSGDDVLYTWGAHTVNGGRGSDTFIVQRDPTGGIFAQTIDGGVGANDYDIVDMSQAGDARFIVRTGGTNRFNVTVASEDYLGEPLNAGGSTFTIREVQEIILGAHDDYLLWGTGADGEVYAGAGDDYLEANSTGGSQRPALSGEAGNDTIVIRTGGYAFGGDGDDRIEVTSGGDVTAEGGAGNDVFFITRMDDRAHGGAGFDKLILEPRFNVGIALNLQNGIASSGNGIFLDDIGGFEEFVTSDASDTVSGSNDDDRIILRAGNDFASGYDGDDLIYGGGGNDSLEGLEGNDLINGGLGNDTISGNIGTDTADFSFAHLGGAEGELVASGFEAVTVDLGRERAEQGIYVDRLNSIENVFGTTKGDHITGDSRDNVLSGGGGQDSLFGEDGDDILIAGTSTNSNFPEYLDGGNGSDRLVVGATAFHADGGFGFDTLVFSGETDAADGGGRTLAVEIDLEVGTIEREVELGRLVWVDSGNDEMRTFDGQTIFPYHVHRTNSIYTRHAEELDLRLPTGEEEDDDIPSFAIETVMVNISMRNDSSTFTNIQNVEGSVGNDILRGDMLPNQFFGGEGDDWIEGRGLNDRIDGGDGVDTAFFSGSNNNYQLLFGDFGDGFTAYVTDNQSDALENGVLRDVEIIEFDQNIVSGGFDLRIFGGMGSLSDAELETFVELYIAYFNRAPDAIGLNFWGTAFANGTTLEEMAAFFVDQDETRATYPEGSTNNDFAVTVYNNVLGRTPDPVGLNFWVGLLDDETVSRDQFILEVLRGAKAAPPDGASPEFIAQQLIDQRYLSDKTDIGAFFSVHRGMSDVENARDVMELFDGSTASIDDAVAAIEDMFRDALAEETAEFLITFAGVFTDPFA